ncbi:isoleucine--tRNA ligase [Sphingopyxis terrae]|uniref:Isoleucine--tRNA ligase n=1 Tax=Sphingopyxis terrae subsp. ummariensis TaxID=429001 RepID=A0A1Y6EXU3_9SPHN|nr:isoleucine--tRNA ligase [Sphingopyxis terrae]PCF92279.1 isoleucine--tRNA ligase [Sphingopyxis terrae subsp. ummariensis]SMQ65103.1 Isoleucyl-tRNA synthetase [Sphingopyxis terrae subsp. ummariensis]
MTDSTSAPDQRDYRDTVFLPKTDFPMKAGLPQKEPLILAKWIEGNLEGQIRESRKGRDQFILHDGPPYANGDMHIGHALNHILKDMVVRTQTLKGKDAPYVPGWDCHGLPIEWKVEEQYRKKKLNKDEVPVEEFRAECRAYAQHWVDTQREQLKRLGIGGDWDHPYLTMDYEAEATIVRELLKFAANDMLYRGAKPVMWSPVEKTALAEAEVEYEDIVSTQIDVAFEIVESPIPELVGAHAVIWTTTPWTIPVNQALAYGPEIEYALVTTDVEAEGAPAVWNRPEGTGYSDKSDKEAWGRAERVMDCMYGETRYLIAKNLVSVVEARLTAALAHIDVSDMGAKRLKVHLPILQTVRGSDLAGTIARHPMHALGGFFARPRPFLAGDFVTTDSGTGLVHMAPDHGEDDFDLCKANGLDPVFAVEGDGKYRADWGWLGGQGSVINPKFNAPDGPICTDLRDAGALLAASADYKHSYPHSWRSKAKVIYRCTPQWFVPMDKVMTHIEPKTPREKRWENEGGAINPHEEDLCDAPTLRQAAMQAIDDTRFVPAKGRNRIGSMVEGRPDWVLSRQRAWGVPITLFVDRKTGQYLNDPVVNDRIVAAVKEAGVDAWSDARAQEYLGDAYNAADYERITDILDVWFDSGCTHAFVLESGRWPALVRHDGGTHSADLYLEGSDQHRGWFQSSLLESCGTRGQAPYKAVLTHGFTMDAKGFKMSKSLGNTISPIDLMRDYGADILRLWALSVDFTEDHRIGKEILAGVADQYRKLRNTFRYLLGALDGFSDEERITDVAAMPELERYMLSLLADLDAKLRQAVDDFDYNAYTRLLADFCNEDLSAFYFDIRKDVLYCDLGPAAPLGTDTRRAYRSVLDVLFHALVRYAAPVLVFTSEEVWGTRYPEAGSVHLLEWPDFDQLVCPREGGDPEMASADSALGSRLRGNTQLVEKWAQIRSTRALVTERIEPLRREKTIRSSLEAEVWLPNEAGDVDYEEIFITSTVHQGDWGVKRTENHKCGRCWRHLPEVTADGALCNRCETVLDAQ